MKPSDALPVAPPDPDLELDGFVGAFEAAYARDGSADPVKFLPPADHPKYRAVLAELLRVDLEFAWDRGDERRVEAYRDRFPGLFADPSGLRAVAWEEFRLRQAAGEAPTPAEYRHRLGVDLFDPGSADGKPPSTRVLPPAVVLARAEFSVDSGPPAAMPDPGDRVCGFEVLSELGRGAFGRVYLAREPGLAGRLVVLKVSSKLPAESQTLARLQHTNIVPIYSVHRHGPYHVICMPYLGATTLADLLHLFHGPAGLPQSGKGLVSTLADRAARTAAARESSGSAPTDGAAPAPVAVPDPGLSRAGVERLERLGYTETVLWLGAQLADGLQHAHERGVLHRDLKPANVLLADDGRPMLLDFNLAADQGLTPDDPHVGGTLRYMPPEALEALAAGRGHADPRADVYGLGLILYELLTGTFPYPDPPRGPWQEVVSRMRADRLAPPRPAARVRRDITPAVGSILATCLHPDPARRYPSAAALREDLQRQLDDRPLKHAPDRSVRERMAKWFRRQSATRVAVVATLVLLATVGAGAALVWRNRELEAGQSRAALAAAPGPIQSLLLDPEAPVGFYDEAEQKARAVLAPYRATEDPDWANCPLLLRLPESVRAGARRDVAFVLYYLAEALAKKARGELDPNRRAELLEAALRVNEQAGSLDDPAVTGMVRRQRADLLRAAGRGEEAARVAGSAPGDGPAEGVIRASVAIREGRYQEAVDALRPFTERPGPSYAVQVMLGYCYLRLGNPADAVRCFDVATVLAPDAVAVYFHRGIALHEVGRHADAEADFGRVLARHPDDPATLLNRALARIGRKDYAAAIADLDRLESLGAPISRLYFVRERARRLAGDRDGADRDLRAGLAKPPSDPLGWVARGQAKLRLAPPDPKGALADFETAVRLDPRLRLGWESIAEVQAERLGRPDEAVRALDRALELSPGHLPSRAGRAVLHARAGRKAEARADAELCLKADPDALVLYQVACVYLLTAEGPADRDRGLGLLKACLRKDPSWARMMPTDPDLKSVHGADAFRRLVAAAAVMAP